MFFDRANDLFIDVLFALKPLSKAVERALKLIRSDGARQFHLFYGLIEIAFRAGNARGFIV
jgi:hypothetical protein